MFHHPDLHQTLLQAHDDFGDGLVVLEDRRIIFANDAICRITGYSREELLSLPDMFTLVGPEVRSQHDADFEEFKRTGVEKAPPRIETVMQNRRGESVPIEVFRNVYPQADALHIVVVVRDISERRARRQELEREVAARTQDLEAANRRLTELDRLKSEFLALMSHELRTPLNAMVGFSSMVEDETLGPLNEQQKKAMVTVRQSADHLLSLINDMLELSRIQAGRMQLQRERVEVPDLVTQIVDSLQTAAQRKGLRLHCSAGTVPPLETDARRLTQIVINLVENAIKFTAEGEVSVFVQEQTGRVAIAVQDTGIGIAPDALPHIWDPFWQRESGPRRHYEGLGLGLYLSQKLAEMLGGSLTARSATGVGSTFTLLLPKTEHEMSWQVSSSGD